MRIVVLDGIVENPGDLSWEPLGALGELTVYDRTSKQQCPERMKDTEIVLTNKTVLTEEILAQCPKLRYIGVLATGYNVVDLKATEKRGILVTNIPSYGTQSVAQYTMALLLELCHHVGEHADSVKKGDWTACTDWCYWRHPMIELAGKTMGILGFGKIGQAVAGLAKAFGMQVIFTGGHRLNEEEIPEGCRQVEQEELFRKSDVISLHCPLNEKTKGMINKESIGKMKTGVLLLNDSRGPLIVEEDLREALEEGKIAGAAVDVVAQEPIPAESPLLQAPNLLITPHIAWAARESRQRLMDTAVENVRRFLEGNPCNVVTK